ncbi:MAG: ATP-binding cassette domain-containing protein, partial [Nitrospiria bacterium]
MSSERNGAASDDVAIRLDGVSKCYQIYEQPHHRLLQGIFRGRRQYFKEFWALKEISFEVKKGETVGIIGRNGSGKSTLLQIICGTLTPTSGTVETHGRVAALLE